MDNFSIESKKNAQKLARMYQQDKNEVAIYCHQTIYLDQDWVQEGWTELDNPRYADYYSMVGLSGCNTPTSHWWDGEDDAPSQAPENRGNPKLWCFFPDFLVALKRNWVRQGGAVLRLQRAIKLARAIGWECVSLESLAELTGISQFNKQLISAWEAELKKAGDEKITMCQKRGVDGSYGPRYPTLTIERESWVNL